MLTQIKKHPVVAAIIVAISVIWFILNTVESIYGMFAGEPLFPATYNTAERLLPNITWGQAVAVWGVLSALAIAFAIYIILITRRDIHIADRTPIPETLPGPPPEDTEELRTERLRTAQVEFAEVPSERDGPSVTVMTSTGSNATYPVAPPQPTLDIDWDKANYFVRRNGKRRGLESDIELGDTLLGVCSVDIFAKRKTVVDDVEVMIRNTPQPALFEKFPTKLWTEVDPTFRILPMGASSHQIPFDVPIEAQGGTHPVTIRILANGRWSESDPVMVAFPALPAPTSKLSSPLLPRQIPNSASEVSGAGSLQQAVIRSPDTAATDEVQFKTEGKFNRLINGDQGKNVQSVRFVPHDTRFLRVDDLPTEVSYGDVVIVIKKILPTGILIDEIGPIDVVVTAEIYYEPETEVVPELENDIPKPPAEPPAAIKVIDSRGATFTGGLHVGERFLEVEGVDDLRVQDQITIQPNRPTPVTESDLPSEVPEEHPET